MGDRILDGEENSTLSFPEAVRSTILDRIFTHENVC